MRFVVGLILGIAVATSIAATRTVPAPQAKPVAWDYKIECFPKNLQKWGDEGWELVATSAAPAAVCLYLKRPKVN